MQELAPNGISGIREAPTELLGKKKRRERKDQPADKFKMKG